MLYHQINCDILVDQELKWLGYFLSPTDFNIDMNRPLTHLLHIDNEYMPMNHRFSLVMFGDGETDMVIRCME